MREMLISYDHTIESFGFYVCRVCEKITPATAALTFHDSDCGGADKGTPTIIYIAGKADVKSANKFGSSPIGPVNQEDLKGSQFEGARDLQFPGDVGMGIDPKNDDLEVKLR